MKTPTKSVTLLLVDDDDIDAMTIQRSFDIQKIGNPIIRCFDGQEAYEMLLSGKIPKPFIVLLDLQMPRMNGFEFLDKIRAHEDLKQIVVFILSTSSAEEDKVKGYSKQIAGYFVKDKAGENFMSIVHLLDSYWSIVQMPLES